MINKLLQRQINKHLAPSVPLTPELESFLGVISESYEHYENDRKMLERSIDISSKEMADLYDQLRKDAEALQEASELKFRSLLQNTSDVITVTDENGYITFS